MFAVLFAASAMLAPPACRDPVIKAERHWVRALEAGDRAALAGLLDEDFSDFDWTGRVRTKADLLVAVTPGRGRPVAVREVEAQTSGQLGVVRGVSASPAPGGKLERAVRFTDVFMCRAGRWRAVAAQETAIQAAPAP